MKINLHNKGIRQSIIMYLLVGILILLRIYDPSPIAKLRLSVFDALQVHSPRVRDSSHPVKVLDIDETSLEKVGQWPWPRHRLSTLMQRLKDYKAKTITLDILLSEPDRWSLQNIVREINEHPILKPLVQNYSNFISNDELLAQSFSETKVIIGFSGDNKETHSINLPRASYAISGDDPALFVPKFLGGIGPLEILYKAASGYGALNWIPEYDQVVRRVPLLINVQGRIYPSLALETLRLASGVNNTIFIRSSGASNIFSFGKSTGIESVSINNKTLITNEKGEIWLKFSPSQNKRTFSAWDLLSGTITPEDINGRHIFIGSSATGLSDLHSTPLSASVSGVEIHAEALEQMLSGDYLLRPAWSNGAEIFFIFFISLLLAYLIPRTKVVYSAILCILSLFIALGISFFFYQKHSFLLDPIYPSVSILAVYLAGSLLSYIRTERERAQIRTAFGHYVSPSVVHELTLNPEKLKLGGETRQITLLFADIRKFSSLSEGMDAEALIQFINKVFSPIAENILNFEGTIDKFMGDGVMAFWNAPILNQQHAAQACQAALALQKSILDFNEQNTIAKQKVCLGIGLNTGSCVVGNVGSPQRFDYSVLGDVVNTASRLEEMTKNYGVPIILGEKTAQAVNNFALLDLGSSLLRGREKKEKLYALLGNEALAVHSRFDDLKTFYKSYAEGMLLGDKNNAEEHLSNCHKLGIKEARVVLQASLLRLQM